ncbi:1-(5-phosphoribosyl)-5-[(5-phosphoribosylamino)methylideneamino]imidazole-4-carboxamide isomerase [Pelosinus baikalensis]|uniref:1-(5-phosphoribosyl)-5-[(5-phosphoribosylamino)methylideneamino] imidazole-4-carboxamide isomerase n=1 Tax=Pelosinus baikalensis TaxID=2892015 RepID=A0ABS8HSU8_9FIRM|nr:1-(5-phosphoribosyl)-5-[(5-phosphoribosylamino)methylideneamino]imidazole-4-carboxamide isomerase [Pelosinus baikalensis]MCC5465167.1 1-(5-phosphoribosyl)-5-[(5-phosphoribosylamino)methylideneamino]imidazole-4-carboxamide isomerase [Pelosinus baikalensis]MCC5465218.1 1-(5-phosphoribosyl)-5-[(5-phosphoribosylamino)methylideneamino]imidazole-4-carboxamide isomerase [Pelosinus baikalensis]
MILFPAIDIRNGKCVRLTEGRFDKETIFADNPLDMAIRWVNEGAEYLHLVDLDGALAGKPVNLSVIADITKNVRIPVQLGGGIRNLDTIAQFLEVGVARVILGSVAVKQPELVAAACEKYGDRIVVGIDARDGVVAVDGWGIAGGIGAEELAEKMAGVGVARIIYTDISRDGTLSGVNISATAAVAKASGIPVIASGGVRDLSDIEAIKKATSDGIEGVIVGKAIYTGSLNLADALCLLRGE